MFSGAVNKFKQWIHSFSFAQLKSVPIITRCHLFFLHSPRSSSQLLQTCHPTVCLLIPQPPPQAATHRLRHPSLEQRMCNASCNRSGVGGLSGLQEVKFHLQLLEALAQSSKNFSQLLLRNSSTSVTYLQQTVKSLFMYFNYFLLQFCLRKKCIKKIDQIDQKIELILKKVFCR